MPAPTRFSTLDPRETRVLIFDFSQGLASGEALAAVVAVDVVLDYGVDAAPASIISSVQVSGQYVLVKVTGMEAPVDYHITVTASTSNPAKTLVVPGVLPVRYL